MFHRSYTNWSHKLVVSLVLPGYFQKITSQPYPERASVPADFNCFGHAVTDLNQLMNPIAFAYNLIKQNQECSWLAEEKTCTHTGLNKVENR